MPLSPEEIARALALIEGGQSQRNAARTLNVPKSTLRDAIQRYHETGSCTRKQGSGRPRKTNAADDRFLTLQALRNRSATAPEISHEIRLARNITISENTVRRRLAEANLRPRVPATAPLLTANHRRARMQFATDHQNWTEQDWGTVLFNDESRFNLYTSDGRARVYRRPGERYAPCMIAPKVQYGGGSIHVWGGICSEAKTELHVFDRGAVNAHVYITNILTDYVTPFAPVIGENFLFMQDNAKPHVARNTRAYLEEVGIPILPWPARSPDLNPIEHICDSLGRRVRRRINPPLNLGALREAIVEEWNNIPQIEVANLIRSMPRRLEEVIHRRGGNTSY
jgi:transposase